MYWNDVANADYDGGAWLTLTWDVLKLIFDRRKINRFQD